MAETKHIPEPWRSFLRELDQRASEETRLDCMGGFVVTVLYGFSRETSDLDVLLIAPREQRAPLLEFGVRGGMLHKKHNVYLDSLVSGYKSKRISCLELSSNSDRESNASISCKMGSFSKIVTLTICRIW